MKVYNLHFSHTKNLGDRVCAPGLYFDFGAKVRDVSSFTPEEGSVLVYGGGGLLNHAFDPHIARTLATKPSKVIAWGLGTNAEGLQAVPYPDWMQSCDLVGIRDYPSPFRWVPCPSCMDPLFDSPGEPCHEVVVYAHPEIKQTPSLCAPRLTNEVETLEEAVAFLASGEYVVTDTYHGAYWATLLQRKVLVYPSATRFKFVRHPYPLLRPGDDWRKERESARLYPEALKECREANIGFHRSVVECLKGDP